MNSHLASTVVGVGLSLNYTNGKLSAYLDRNYCYKRVVTSAFKIAGSTGLLSISIQEIPSPLGFEETLLSVSQFREEIVSLHVIHYVSLSSLKDSRWPC